MKALSRSTLVILMLLGGYAGIAASAATHVPGVPMPPAQFSSHVPGVPMPPAEAMNHVPGVPMPPQK